MYILRATRKKTSELCLRAVLVLINIRRMFEVADQQRNAPQSASLIVENLLFDFRFVLLIFYERALLKTM